jgi:hypothetical protein
LPILKICCVGTDQRRQARIRPLGLARARLALARTGAKLAHRRPVAGDGGVLSFLKDGLVTGIAWGIFGLAAGSLYGLWAGRGVSARRLKGLRPLLSPHTSLLLAWADESVTQETMTRLSTPDMDRLILGFNPVKHGAVLETH